jgi:hypothetical protein
MRTLCLSIAAVSTFLSASCLANRADAITLGGPSAIRAMIVDIDTVYQAHCRPGRMHHRYWPHDGCVEQSVISPSYRRYHRGRSSGSSNQNGAKQNSISKQDSMGGRGHGGSGGGGGGGGGRK